MNNMMNMFGNYQNFKTQYIVNRVAPYPIPSYTVPNPFGTVTTASTGA